MIKFNQILDMSIFDNNPTVISILHSTKLLLQKGTATNIFNHGTGQDYIM